MDYSDNENDYISEQYKDDNGSNDLLHDESINVLKKLSKENNIKAIRQYIVLHKNRLKDIQTRLLNEIVNVNGYKFIRRDGKLLLSKISPSSRYYKATSEYSTFCDNSYKGSPYNQTNRDAFDEMTNETFCDNRDDEAFHENSPYNQTDKGIQMNASYKNQHESSPYNQTNRDDEALNKSILESNSPQKINSLGQTSQLISNDTNRNVDSFQNSINGTQMPQLTNILNSIIKSANEQNENQKTQYEKLSNILEESIQAKSNIEQEQTDKFNKCVATIEKTFSAGTFDKIIEHIDNMASQFVNKQEDKNNEFRNRFEVMGAELKNVLNRTDENQKAIKEAFNELNEKKEYNETIEDMEITIDELRDKIQEHENTIKQLQTNVNSIIKQHSELINKLSLAVYNIDESIYTQIFKEQGKVNETPDIQREHVKDS